MAAQHLEQMQQVIAHAYAHSREVRQRFDAAGLEPADIRSMEDLARIPVRTKDEVIALQQADPPFGGLLAIPESEIDHIFLSPGPLYEPEAGEERTPLDMARLAFEWTGFNAGDVVLNTLSYHLVPAGLLVDWALVELGCTVIPGGVGNRDLQLKMMADLGVTAYAGTPSFLTQLLERAEAMGLDPRSNLKLQKLFATAEPFPASLRQTFADTYGLAVGNCYATAELGFLALDTTGQMAMRLLPQPIIQVVDPDTGQAVGPGEVGEVVVTNFSRAYPLVRFGTGDMAVNLDPRPGESRQDERAIILVGRRGEAVKVRGMFVHPNQIRFALTQVTNVESFQGVVTRPENRDRFTLRVVLAEGAAGDSGLAEQLKESVRNACRVRLDEVEFVSAEAIPAGAPGMVDKRDWQQ